jgi:hypothetical protein
MSADRNVTWRVPKYDDATPKLNFLYRFAEAVAELNRLFSRPEMVFDMMHACGITLPMLKRAEVDPYDYDEIASCMKHNASKHKGAKLQ